jgi:hypothetical protein
VNPVRDGQAPPCQVCGATGTDFGGYCQQCRTYRGVFESGAAAVLSGVHNPAAGHVPADHPVAVTGPQPMPPPQPTPPVAPVRRRSPFAMALVALSTVLVVLTAGIVTVTVVRAGKSVRGEKQQATLPTSSQPPSPTASPSSTVDKCLVGDWNVASANAYITDPKTKRAELFTSRGGSIWRFRADGTGEYDLAKGITYTGSENGVPVTYVSTGRITFNFKTVDNVITFTSVKFYVQQTITIGGKSTTQVPADSPLPPFSYVCGTESLTMGHQTQAYALRRGSATS